MSKWLTVEPELAGVRGLLRVSRSPVDVFDGCLSTSCGKPLAHHLALEVVHLLGLLSVDRAPPLCL